MVQLPYSVTSTNIRRWEWKGDQQTKKEMTTTTQDEELVFFISYIIYSLPSMLITVFLPCKHALEIKSYYRVYKKK